MNKHNSEVSLNIFHSFFLIFLLLFACFAECWAEQIPEKPADSQLVVTPEILKGKIKEVEATTDLPAGVKNKLLELYRKSLVNLEATTANNALTDKFVQSIEVAPTETRKIRGELEKLSNQPADKEIDVPEGATTKDLEQLLLKSKSNVTAIEAKVATVTSQLAAQTERPAKASQRLAEAQKSEEQLLAALKGPSPADEPPQVTEARQWMQQTQLQALHSETKKLNQELVSMPVLLELANAQRDEAVSQLERARSLVQGLEAKVNQRRQVEAAKTVEQAEEVMRVVAGGPPLIQQTAAKNIALSNELQAATTNLERIAAEKDTVANEQKKIEESLKNARQKIELAGLSQALGFVLNELQRNLPNVRLLQKKVAANEEMIAEVGLRLVQYKEERKRLDDIDTYIAEITADLSPEGEKKADAELRKLLISRQELLDKLITSNRSTLSLLAEFDIIQRQYLNTVITFDTFLAENLLWMRSTPSLRLKDVSNIPKEIKALLAPRPWLAVAKQLAAQAVSSPIFAFASLATVILLWGKGRLRILLEKLVRQASNPVSYHFSLTLKVVGLMLLLALPWPLLLMTLGWLAQTVAEATDYSRAMGTGLIKTSYRLYLLLSLRMLLLPKGLAAEMFHWPEATLKLLRRETKWLVVTFIPAIFITQVAFLINYRFGGGVALARLTFVALLAVLAVSFYRVLHPKTGVWEDFCKKNAQRFFARLYPVFFLLVMLVPVLFVGLILTGFIITSGVLMNRYIDSLWLALVLVVCHQLIKQWLIQTGRKLAIQEAENQPVPAREVERNKQTMAPDTEAEPVAALDVLSANSRKLLDTVVGMAGLIGLWMVWADVLPAFEIFDKITLWKYSVVVNGETQQVPVTARRAGLAIFIGIITLSATRRFPALLEMVLLQHLNVTAGGRYTVITLSRYVIGGIGLMLVVDIFGFSWGQIQWLVAALGVGIGFGMQEIVANFISGLIILFERPIRVGDVVTIGDTDGVVTRIRIRATTIRDYDGKELLVPNKEFITGRLLNWSLSDPVTRVTVPVGIAYGSDVKKAMNLMAEAARENTMILKDPKPAITFDSFGDNALLLTLRCFVGSVDYRVPAKSNLHKAIDLKFREAGISMAFPQRDIHLDTSKPLDIRILREVAREQEETVAAGVQVFSSQADE